MDTLISSYNLKYHRSIKMSPKDTSLKKNETKVYRNLYGDLSALEPQLPKFKVGDNMRISKKILRKAIHLDGLRRFSKYMRVQMTRPVTYKLEDLNEKRKAPFTRLSRRRLNKRCSGLRKC